MKKIKFIRHSKPADPFADYTKLSFDQISDLATEKFTPNIHPDTPKLILEKFTAHEIARFNVILCSKSKRSIQTALQIKKLSKKNIKIIQTDNLAEIKFDPAITTTENKFIKNGLNEIRTSLFKGMKKGIGAESLHHVLERSKALETELRELPYENILCITHSFYMRVLHLFFLENLTQDKDISVPELINTIDHSYLDGFEIRLSN